MRPTIPNSAVTGHRVISDVRPEMLKSDLRKAETRDHKADIGSCLDFARRAVGWTLDQLAKELARDARQIRRWCSGEERAQLDVIWGVAPLRGPFLVALAQLETDADVVTTISLPKPKRAFR
jgi:cytochrome c551/c552